VVDPAKMAVRAGNAARCGFRELKNEFPKKKNETIDGPKQPGRSGFWVRFLPTQNECPRRKGNV